jgi:pyruvate/2-oxoglutarate dehydrogenase complex dihydrolipoamide dehydrogenase (E3) component
VRTYDGFTPDLVVVGGGMGGISATLRATALGARVLLVEPAALGGT